MKEQVVRQLLEYIENTKDFVLEQAPDVLLQALRYEKFSNFLGGLLSFALIVFTLSIAYYCWKNPALDEYDHRDFLSAMGVFIPLVISPLLFVQLLTCIDKLIKIYVAPKYFLLQLVLKMKE